MKPITTLLVAGAIISSVTLHAASTPSETFEKDRKAILGMTGGFAVKFFFHETMPLQAGYQPIAIPYESAAARSTVVLQDKADGRSFHDRMEAMAKRVTQGDAVADTEIRDLIGAFVAVAPDQTKH